jgi:hypothetical protein
MKLDVEVLALCDEAEAKLNEPMVEPLHLPCGQADGIVLVWWNERWQVFCPENHIFIVTHRSHLMFRRATVLLLVQHRERHNEPTGRLKNGKSPAVIRSNTPCREICKTDLTSSTVKYISESTYRTS